MNRTTLTSAALALAVAAVLAWVVLGGQDGAAPTAVEPAPVVDFPAFAVPEDVRESWRGHTAGELSEDTVAFVEQWRAANVVLALRALDLFDGEPDEVLVPFESTARRYGQSAERAELDRAAHAAFAMFEAGLGEISRKASTTRTPLRALLANPADAAAQEAYGACGDFPLFALQQGMVAETGELQVSRDVLRLVFRYRWYVQFTSVRPIDSLMDGPELRAFRRWRMERAVIEPEARQRLVAEFGDSYGFDAYPESFASGVVSWQANRPEQALQQFDEALAEDPENEWVQAVRARAQQEMESN